MPDLDFLAIVVSGAVVFIIGGAYYAFLGDQLATVSEAAAAAPTQPPPWELAVELARGLLLAAVVAGLASQGEIDERRSTPATGC